MGRGRVTKEEQKRRIRFLLEFIFIFRYATRHQLFEFGRSIIGLVNPRWLIDYACKRGLVRSYPAPGLKVKIYYLTTQGMDLIQGSRIKWPYHFDRRLAALNAVTRQSLLVNVYLMCSRYLDAQLTDWNTKWLIDFGKYRRETLLPDSVFGLPCGVKISVTIELHYKRINYFKKMLDIYRYDIEKAYRYHAVLIVASPARYYESLKRRLARISPYFCPRGIIFTNPEILKQGLCFYNNEAMELNDAVELVRAKGLVVPQQGNI